MNNPVIGVIVGVRALSSDLQERLLSEYDESVIQIDNSSAKGLCQKYNRGIEVLELDGRQGWIIFCHDDVSISCSPAQLYDKLAEMEDIGAQIVVAAGTTKVPPINPGYWWYGITNANFRGAGAVTHRTPDSHTLYHVESYGPFPQQVAAFDGLWFAVKSSLFSDPTFRFDEAFDGYHYYDADFAALARSRDIKMWATGIPVTHHNWGRGISDPEFIKYQKQFICKWSQRAQDYKKFAQAEINSDFVKKTTAFKN